jgi:hypothetical protein
MFNILKFQNWILFSRFFCRVKLKPFILHSHLNSCGQVTTVFCRVIESHASSRKSYFSQELPSSKVSMCTCVLLPTVSTYAHVHRQSAAIKKSSPLMFFWSGQKKFFLPKELPNWRHRHCGWSFENSSTPCYCQFWLKNNRIVCAKIPGHFEAHCYCQKLQILRPLAFSCCQFTRTKIIQRNLQLFMPKFYTK